MSYTAYPVLPTPSHLTYSAYSDLICLLFCGYLGNGTHYLPQYEITVTKKDAIIKEIGNKVSKF